MITIPFTTDRLIVREFSDFDIDCLIQIVGNSEFIFYAFPASSRGNAEIRHSVELFLENIKIKSCPDYKTGMRENYKLAVCLQDTDQLIGYVALDEFSQQRGEMRDIGYFVDPRYWNQGYATEAISGLLDRVLSFVPGNDLWATVHPDNVRSQAVLQKLGLVDTGDRTVNKAGKSRLIYYADIGSLSPRVPNRHIQLPQQRILP